ncbi:MAG: hypothetical protein ACC662_08520 [Planctomycetota bacterium]
MGRLIAIILGGAALAFFIPLLVPTPLSAVNDLWRDILQGFYDPLKEAGGGLFAGLALVLLAVRGKE